MLSKVHHIAIICRDYSVSKAFYTDTLGLTIIREVYRAERRSYKLDLALNGEYIIELFSFPDPPERASRPEAAGLRHLAFEVDDLDLVVETLKQKVIDCLQTIYDPEIPVSIYELGLIYETEVMTPFNNVQIVMTLTAPGCPAAQDIPVEVEQKVRQIEGVNEVSVEVTWTPPWNKDMMSEAARLELGMM
jgi:FeS assembly SUF system protein